MDETYVKALEGVSNQFNQAIGELTKLVIDGFVTVNAKMDRGFASLEERMDRAEQRLDRIEGHLGLDKSRH